MTEDDALLLNMDRLAVIAGRIPVVSPGATSATSLTPSRTGQGDTRFPTDGTERLESSGNLSGARPGEAKGHLSTLTGVRRTPWESPLGLIEFGMLWTTMGVPIAAIAQHYGHKVRSVHRWRAAAGLLPRYDLLRGGANLARVYALRAQAVAGVLSPEAKALLVQASRRTVTFPWNSPLF